MMSRFTSFLRKYYLGGASAWAACCGVDEHHDDDVYFGSR
jgi:hypothetical protein